MRDHLEVLADWSDELAARLGRPVAEIRARGLSAHDFIPGRSVRLNFGDGSHAEFRHAFACVRREAARVAVFTEHCGYLEFALTPQAEVIETHEHVYRQA